MAANAFKPPVYPFPADVASMLRTPVARRAPTPSRDDTLPWREWTDRYVPSYVAAGFSERHVQFWEWAWSIEPGARPRPFIAIWPRGGGKSTTCELITAAVMLRGKRRYALYVSGTQDQADKHVEAIGTILERLNVQRSVNKYGTSRGWRRNRLRAADGFTIDAFGLDTGSRGTKDDDARPDLIVFDDIDQVHDSTATTRKKVEVLTQTVLPTAIDTAAVVGVQNLITAHGIFAQLADRSTPWLADRIISGPYPALLNCVITPEQQGDETVYRVSGMPTWEGQCLDACQRIITTMGPDAFWRECQHRVDSGGLAIYPNITTIDPFDIPDTWQRYVGLDYGGVHTCAIILVQEPVTLRWIVVDEYLAGGVSIEEHAHAILRRCGSLEPFAVGGSKSEEQWRREFRKSGLAVNGPQFADVEVGIDRVSGALNDGSLVVMRHCTGLLNNLRTYRRAPDERGKPTKDIVNKSTYHYADALRYIIGRVR